MPTILQVFGFLLIHLAQWNIFKRVISCNWLTAYQALILKITSWQGRDTAQKARNEQKSIFFLHGSC
jgi:hypothetical protein